MRTRLIRVVGQTVRLSRWWPGSHYHRAEVTVAEVATREEADALMVALFDWAGGGPTEAGPCAARNLAPLRYLERCGFRIVGRRERIGKMGDRWRDVVLLERRSRIAGA